MAEPAAPTSWRGYVYTPEGGRLFLFVLLSLGAALPVLFTARLSVTTYVLPLAIIAGVLVTRADPWAVLPGPLRTAGAAVVPRAVRARLGAVPTWVVFDCVSFAILVCSAYRAGVSLPPAAMLGFLLAVLVYDVVGVETGGMQRLNRSMLTLGVPIVFLLPHSPAFEYGRFREIVEEEGLAGLHGSPHGVTMLGIGDAVLPSAAAISAGSLGAARALGPVALTLPQVGALVGGVGALGVLLWADVPRAVAALTASVPGTMLGLAAAIAVDPTATVAGLGLPF